VLIVDHRGAPLLTDVAPSNVHDSKLLRPTIKKLSKKRFRKPKVLAADSAFDAHELRHMCKLKNILLTAATNLRRSPKRSAYSPKGR